MQTNRKRLGKKSKYYVSQGNTNTLQGLEQGSIVKDDKTSKCQNIHTVYDSFISEQDSKNVTLHTCLYEFTLSDRA